MAEEQINFEKRKKLKRIVISIGAVFGIIIFSKKSIADVFLGYNTKSDVHTFSEASYPGTVTRTDGEISQVTVTKPNGNEVVTITRDGNGNISQVTTVYDGTTKTVTFTRDVNGNIESWSVS